MANQVLRDSRGVKIGEIQETGGKFVIRDARGVKKGEYDPKTNTTRDERGVKVGTGNLLTTLLQKPHKVNCLSIGSSLYFKFNYITIQELLTNWKSDALFGERHFERQSTTLIEGQDLYLISVRYNVSVDGQCKLIEKHKFFQTRVQGLTDFIDINPKADEYICNQILLQLENDFYSEYANFIDEEIRKKTSP